MEPFVRISTVSFSQKIIFRNFWSCAKASLSYSYRNLDKEKKGSLAPELFSLGSSWSKGRQRAPCNLHCMYSLSGESLSVDWSEMIKTSIVSYGLVRLHFFIRAVLYTSP